MIYPFRRRVAAAILAGLLGCSGGDSSNEPIDAAVVPTDGPACDPNTPRTIAPEVFVGPSGLQTRIENLINAATGSIDLQMYSFTVNRIADRLVAAATRGVAVRVLLDGTQLTPSIRTRLEAGGVMVKLAPAGFPNAHAKYMVIGGPAGQAVISSGNFTVAGFEDQRNYGVINREPQDVADLAAVFAADWAGQAADIGCSRLVISPSDARARVLALITNAQTTLDAELYYLADSAVRQALVVAHTRGVAVRVILADPSEMPENSGTADTLKAAGIAVKTLASPVAHAKLLIVDDVALIGSHNMSTTSLRDNREVGVLVREGNGAAVAEQQFDQDWAAATAW